MESKVTVSTPTRFWILALCLATLAGGTWIVRNINVEKLRTNEDQLRAEIVLEAFRTIASDLTRLQEEMLALGQTIANSSAVQEGLVGYRASSGPTRDVDLVEYVDGLELPERVAIELYTPSPQLVAWLGYSMPLDDAPSQPEFLETYQTAFSSDQDKRHAMVVWVPVRDGPRILGAVRVMQLLHSTAPVQNAFLRDYDIASEWSRKTRLPIRIAYSAPFDDEMPTGGNVRLIVGIDGSVLGRVFVDRPSGDRLVQAARDRYDDVIAVWLAVLGAWLLAGIWMWYRRLPVVRMSADGFWTARLFRLLATVGGLWAYRFFLIFLDLPNRLQPGRAPLSPLYDPTHFASTFLGGLMQSVGDLLLSSMFLVAFGLILYHFVSSSLDSIKPVDSGAPNSSEHANGAIRSRLFGYVGMLAPIAVLAALVVVFSQVVERMIIDSTLDYFALTGLLPENLILAVFVAALLITLGVVLIFGSSLVVSLVSYQRHVVSSNRTASSVFMPLTLALVIVASIAFLPSVRALVSPWLILFVFVGLFGAGVIVFRWSRAGVASMTFRNVLLAIFWLTATAYPLLYNGLSHQRALRLADATETFEDGSDPRVEFAIHRILRDTGARDDLAAALVARKTAGLSNRDAIDSIATSNLRRSLLASLGSYDVSLTIFDKTGTTAGGYYEADQRLTSNALEDIEKSDFDIVYAMYQERGTDEALVEQMTGRRARERFRYLGFQQLVNEGEVLGWVMASAEPRSIVEEAGTPFPRVLVPIGFYGNLEGDISLAEFREGVLVRNTGRDFGRYRLSEEASAALVGSANTWRKERVRGKEYDTYYQKRQSRTIGSLFEGEGNDVVVAARTQSINTFDHLYYLLRLTVAGLFLGFPIYLFGLYRRRRAGLLPAREVRFRDKVLNAFFAVGLIAVAAMGFVGLEVVTGENERAIESWLRQHLERVEKTLAIDAAAGELTYSVLDRTSVDSLAARVGLDLNVYRATDLVESSRAQLIRDRLIDRRLPMAAYKALFFDGFRFTSTEEQLGNFVYTAGYRALTDEEGRPVYVVSVPTLPEQERIEEERARTIAYLFGALLLLVFVVLITASVLANALTRPIARLREGLEAVAKGRFERITSFDSRDEFDELVETFNSMQDQLSDSRRQLAQQERQLAWREMARQVAHEIKNPLTPMKLSVQHLRRSFSSTDDRDTKEFQSLFDRITTTIVDQIDALARIANEFSTFARMPRRIVEPLDLNTVITEAVALMQAESDVSITMNLEDAVLEVGADREELRRIYINLIKNGIQAAPPTRDSDIKIASRREVNADGVAIAYSEVIDNGSGIADELRKKIFEPNFSTKNSGTGLGLAIVRKSIEDMNGEIGFKTAIDVGTTFWIRLPLTD